MTDLSHKKEYETWCKKADLADCFRDLGLNRMADNIMPSSIEIFDQYLSIIKKEAMRYHNRVVMDRLCYLGFNLMDGGI
jgi:hypothetical protein